MLLHPDVRDRVAAHATARVGVAIQEEHQNRGGGERADADDDRPRLLASMRGGRPLRLRSSDAWRKGAMCIACVR
jgi:hypothetical protein